MNYHLYDDIIAQIHDDKIREFTIKCLKDAPSELDTIPASKSGKYHPAEACEDGGLVWHVQRACWFGYQTLEAYKWDKDDIRGDIILSALLLHDIGKKSNYSSFFDYVNHPKTASSMISKNRNMLEPKVFSAISSCVLHHMGPFGPKDTMKPITKYNILELAVYNADFLASRKSIKVV